MNLQLLLHRQIGEIYSTLTIRLSMMGQPTWNDVAMYITSMYPGWGVRAVSIAK